MEMRSRHGEGEIQSNLLKIRTYISKTRINVGKLAFLLKTRGLDHCHHFFFIQSYLIYVFMEYNVAIKYSIIYTYIQYILFKQSNISISLHIYLSCVIRIFQFLSYTFKYVKEEFLQRG